MKKKKQVKNQIIINLPVMNRHTISEVHHILESIVRSYEKLYCDQIQQHDEEQYRKIGLWKVPDDKDNEIPF